ncbi:MAG: trigger factor [Thermogutta sp.]
MTFSNPSEFDDSLSSSSGDQPVSDVSGESASEPQSDLEQGVAVAAQAEGEEDAEAPQPPLEYEHAIEEVDACKRRVLVTIPKREVQRFFADELSEIKDTAAVPGFRPGHVPRKLLEKRYWVELKDSLKAKLMLAAFEDLSEKKAFSPISDPDLDLDSVELPDDGDFVFEFSIEVRPEFTVENWKGLKVKRPIYRISEEHRNRQARRSLEKMAELEEIDDAAEMGDYIVADVTLRLDDRVVNSSENETIRIRPTLSFLDAVAESFGETMAGVRAGETRTCPVVVSQECRDPELAGKTVEAVFKVRAVKRPNIAAVLAEQGKTEEQFLNEWREEAERYIDSWLESNQARVIRQSVLNQLIDQVRFDLPRDLVKKQTVREVRRMALELQSQGYTKEEIQARLNQLQREAAERVDRLLREHFLLEQLAEQEGIDASEEDLEREVIRIAEQAGESPRRVRAQIEQENAWDVLRNQVIERKVIERVLEFAEVEDEAKDLEWPDEDVEFALSESVARSRSEEAADQAQGESA